MQLNVDLHPDLVKEFKEFCRTRMNQRTAVAAALRMFLDASAQEREAAADRAAPKRTASAA